MIEDMNNLMDAAEIAMSGSKGVYRLGVTSTLGSYLLAYLLPEIHQQYHHLKFIVREDAPNILVGGLTDGRHDLLLIPLPLNNDSFYIEPLIREELFIVMANDHPLADKSSITTNDLVGEKVVNMEDTHLYSKQIDELCNRFSLAPLKDYQGTSLDALRAMVSTGVGIAFFPSLYVHSEIRAESNLHVMRIQGEPIYRMHAIAWRHSSPARTFFREFSVVFKELIKEKLGGVVQVM
jgi:LysR family hydrogen peroxide-inducible transcriptional activator